MLILTYSALMTKNKLLLSQVDKLKKMANLLLQESSVQRRIIAQLKQLYRSCSDPILKSFHDKKFCDCHHFGCEIIHARFNYINGSPKVLVTKKVETLCKSFDPTNSVSLTPPLGKDILICLHIYIAFHKSLNISTAAICIKVRLDAI